MPPSLKIADKNYIKLFEYFVKRIFSVFWQKKLQLFGGDNVIS